jgi:hypothetical protein
MREEDAFEESDWPVSLFIAKERGKDVASYIPSRIVSVSSSDATAVMTICVVEDCRFNL